MEVLSAVLIGSAPHDGQRIGEPSSSEVLRASLGTIARCMIGMTNRDIRPSRPMTALDDVSIKVEAGSFHALLGENGAGKSTLVKCIMGFYAADKGQVLVDGREPRSPSARRPRARHRHGLPALHAGAR
jgi:ABC-type multidrug transport system fused ATPase/permease subunit